MKIEFQKLASKRHSPFCSLRSPTKPICFSDLLYNIQPLTAGARVHVTHERARMPSTCASTSARTVSTCTVQSHLTEAALQCTRVGRWAMHARRAMARDAGRRGMRAHPRRPHGWRATALLPLRSDTPCGARRSVSRRAAARLCLPTTPSNDRMVR
jgi:hypothetical protein